MAAVAYDVAALALKGPTAELNFPSSASSLPVPISASPHDIQAAAASAAAAAGAAADALAARGGGGMGGGISTQGEGGGGGGVNTSSHYDHHEEISNFVDEDLIFDMPNVLMNMAEGMLLSPPRLDVPSYVVPDDEDDDNVANGCEDHSLWNYP